MMARAVESETAESRRCPKCTTWFDEPLDFCPKDGARLIVLEGEPADRVGEVLDASSR